VSDRVLLLAIAGLGVLGLGIASYLTWVHYAGISPACSTGGCEKVQVSDYAELRGIPVALLGLVGYILILGSLTVRGEAGRSATAALAMIGFGYSAYLTYLELFVIDAICQWCVASAVVMALLVPLTARRLLRDPGSGER